LSASADESSAKADPGGRRLRHIMVTISITAMAFPHLLRRQVAVAVRGPAHLVAMSEIGHRTMFNMWCDSRLNSYGKIYI
jgi:hypothetical protein